jgi:hypothetical protein
VKYKKYLIYAIFILLIGSYIGFNIIKNNIKNNPDTESTIPANSNNEQKPAEKPQNGDNSQSNNNSEVSNENKSSEIDITMINTIPNTIGNTSGNIANGGYAAQQGKWMYYTNLSRQNYSSMYRSMPDGETGLKKLKQNGSIQFINVIGEWVYYYNSSNGSISKIKTDGTGGMDIIDETVFPIVVGMVVVNDWIYYSIPQLGIFKIKTDGTGKMQLIRDEVISPFSIENNSIYFSLNSHVAKDSDVGLYKVDLNGSNRVKLTGDDCGNIIVDKDWIYYRNAFDNSTLYKIKKDGTQRQKLLNLPLFCFNISDDAVYYSTIEDPGNLYKLNLSDRKQSKLTNNTTNLYESGVLSGIFSILAVNIIDENIYCLCNNPSGSFFYRVKKDGSLDKIIY